MASSPVQESVPWDLVWELAEITDLETKRLVHRHLGIMTQLARERAEREAKRQRQPTRDLMDEDED